MVQQGSNGLGVDELSRGVAGGAKVDELDLLRAGGGENSGDSIDIGREVGLQVDLDDLDVVDLGGDGVHSVGRRAGQDLVLAGDTEHAEEGVDTFVRADTEEHVLGLDGFSGLHRARRGDVAKVAELLLELNLVRVRVTVEGSIVVGSGEGGSEGVLVGVEENVASIVLVVTGRWLDVTGDALRWGSAWREQLTRAHNGKEPTSKCWNERRFVG